MKKIEIIFTEEKTQENSTVTGYMTCEGIKREASITSPTHQLEKQRYEYAIRTITQTLVSQLSFDTIS